MEPNFSSGGPHTLSVRALNVLHRLRRKRYDGNWYDETDSAIARSFDGKIDPDWRNSGQDARRIPMDVEVDENAQGEEPAIVFVGQKNEYDIDFLWRRAHLRSYVVEIRRRDDGEEFLYFGPSNVRGPVAYSLAWGSGLVDLRITLTTANQVKKVTVRGWDRDRQRAIAESVDWNDKELRKLNPSLSEIVMQCDPREERVVTRPVFTKAQALAEARAILKGHAQELVKASGTTIGLPNLRAGSKIVLANIGGRVSGEYFVTETTHTIGDSGYVTKFVARREDPDTGEAL
jgi:phage protein D